MVGINTETDFPGAAEEHFGDSGDKKLPAGGFGREGEYLAWLEADLKAAAAERDRPGGRPWIIAGGHRPHPASAAPLFAKYGVDIYFAGHSHSYARSAPSSGLPGAVVETHHALNHYAAPNATTWIVVGGAGCDEMKQGAVTAEEELEESAAMLPKGSAVVKSSRYATGVLTANFTSLSWRLIDSVTGDTLDTLLITK